MAITEGMSSLWDLGWDMEFLYCIDARETETERESDIRFDFYSLFFFFILWLAFFLYP